MRVVKMPEIARRSVDGPAEGPGDDRRVVTRPLQQQGKMGRTPVHVYTSRRGRDART